MDESNGKASERRLPDSVVERLAAIKVAARAKKAAVAKRLEKVEAALARKTTLAKEEAAKGEGAEERRLPAPLPRKAVLAKQQAAEEGPHTLYSNSARLEKRAALLRMFDAVSAVKERKEAEVTFEFDDVSSSVGGIVAGDPTDPNILAAARAAIGCFNEYKVVMGVRKGPKIVVFNMIMDTNLCNSMATGYLAIVSIKRVNIETLEPEVPGVFYYITLVCKDDRGNDAEYQLKILSGPSYYVKIFRRAPCMDMVNVSEPSSYQPQEVVQELKPMLMVEA